MRESAKLRLESRGTEDLFGCLRRLFHHRDCTMGPCPICGAGSRSGEICAKCIGLELQDRGAKLGKVEELLQCRQEMQELMRRLEDAEKYVAQQIENKPRIADAQG